MLSKILWLSRRLALLLLVLGVARPVLATHLLGGEMTCRYLDANGPAAAPLRYEITITIYNNCGDPSIHLPRTTANVGIYNLATGAKINLKAVNYPYTTSTNGGSGSQSGVMSIPQTSVTDCMNNTVPAGCTVTGPSQPYIVEKFVAIVNLPTTTSGYYAVFTDGWRNVDVTNLSNPGSETLMLYTTLDPPTLLNHSAVFADFALAVICAGETTIQLNNAYDEDGDRLVYSFGQPYGQDADWGVLPTTFTPPAPVAPYVAGYGLAMPFGTGGGQSAAIDPATGIATYFATTQGKYSVAVDVKEYRTINGQEVLVGTTRRDILLVVASCPNVKPPVLPLVATTPRNYTIEAGATFTLPIKVTQADSHPLSLTATSELLDGTGGHAATLNGSAGTVPTGNTVGSVTVAGTNGTVTGTLAYTAACTDARPAPYDLAIVVKDGGCAGKTAVDVFRVTVTKPTGPTAISGSQAVCTATPTYSYMASGGTFATVNWQVTGGTIVGSASANPVQVSWTTPGTGKLTATGVSKYNCPAETVSINVTIASAMAATVSLATPTAQCAGTAFSFKPVVANAGTSPTYAWFVNNTQVATTPTYTSSSLKNGDQVRVELTPTAGSCAAGAAVSATVSISVAGNTPATVSLATPAAQCPGTTFSFKPVVTNAGASPTYAWFVNNVPVATTATYSSATLKAGDQVRVQVTPTPGPCVGTAVSATVSISVAGNTPATVSLATPAAQCVGTAFSFKPTVANAGTSPTYAWFVNNTQVATTATYSSSSLKNGDQVRVQVTPTAGSCAAGAVSATVSVTVNASVVASVSLATPAAQCAGTAFSFKPTVTNAGASPTYAWFVNNTQVATTATYSSTTLQNGDQVRVELTPTPGPCTNGKVSATVSISVTSNTPASVSLTTPAAQCVGTAFSFKPTVANAGTSPTYAWFVNNVPVATTPTYTSSSLKNGDQVRVELTPTAGPCAAGKVSATVSVTVNAIVTPTVSLATPAAQCVGTAFSFKPTVTNAGASPTYAWFVNNSRVATTPTYSSSTLKNGDQVRVELTPTAGLCATGMVSATVSVTVNAIVTPTVSLATPTAQCAGTAFSFKPVVANAGASPTHAWFVNNTQVATTATYSSTTLQNGDQVRVQVTPTPGPCVGAAVSATVSVTVNAILTPTVSLATPTAQCVGTAFSFKPVVTNAGTSPTYTWFVNNVLVATTATYSSTTLQNNDQVRVQVTPTASLCAAGTASAAVRVNFVSTPNPTVVIGTKTPLPVCTGTAIVWQVLSKTNASASPTYQWLVNGAPVAGATGPTFTSTQVPDGQAVSVVLSVATPCGTVTATSNAVPAQITPVLHVAAGPDQEITEGEQVKLDGQADGPYVLRWTPAQSLTFAAGDTLHPLAAPLVTTTYTLRGSVGDCDASSQVTVLVHPRLRIPSAISPNGDGQDDTWEIDHIGDYPANHVTVFNRWGNKVFESTGYGRGREWDGTVGGQPAPIGTYYYTITLESGKSYSGPLTVLY